jgi:RNA polymerase sigma factor for flagellar operon FliA
MLSDEERESLVLAHMTYARKIARGIARTLPPFVDFEEIESWARLGLVQAAQRWDPTAGAAFTTFAWLRIRGAVYRGIELAVDIPTEFRREATIGALSDGIVDAAIGGLGPGADPRDLAGAFAEAVRGIAVVELCRRAGRAETTAVDPAASAESNDLCERLRIAVRDLDPDDKGLIDAVYSEGLSLAEYGRRLLLDRSTIMRRHARVIDELRARISIGEKSRQSAVEETVE